MSIETKKINKKIKLLPYELLNKKENIMKKIKEIYENKCIDIGYVKKISKINKIDKYGTINYEVYDGSIFYNVYFTVKYYPLLEEGTEIEIIINNCPNNMLFGNYKNIYDCLVIDVKCNNYTIGNSVKVKILKSFVLLGENLIKIICELL